MASAHHELSPAWPPTAEPRSSLPANVKDFQLRHQHFHLFESDEALPHFSSIYLPQIVWLKGFAYPPQNISYPLG